MTLTTLILTLYAVIIVGAFLNAYSDRRDLKAHIAHQEREICRLREELNEMQRPFPSLGERIGGPFSPDEFSDMDSEFDRSA